MLFTVFLKRTAITVKLSISNKDIIKLSAPIAVAMLIPQISFLTDTVFLGRLGERELGANGMAGIFYLLLAMVGVGLTNGIQVQLSRRAGEENYHGLAKTFTNGMMLCLVFGIVLMGVAMFAAPAIFNSTLQDPENASLSITYLNVRMWGIPFLMLTQLANAFYIATGQSKYLIHGSIIANAVNIVLDYALIFGELGLPEMGMEGAALASVISEVVFVIVMYGIFYAKKMQVKYPILSSRSFDVPLAKQTLIVAAPLIVQFLFSIGGWQIFFIYVEHLGTRELAVSQILRSVFGVAGIGLWSLAASCNTMVSNVIGQGKQRLVIPVILRTIKIAVAYAAILGLLLVIFPVEFLSLYRDDAEMIQLAIPSLRIVAISSVLMGVATVLFNGVMGTGNTKVNLFIEVGCVLSYVLYCTIAIEQMRLPLHWAWMSEFVYWGTLTIACALYLRTGKWKGKMV